MNQPTEAIECFFRAFERSSDSGDMPALIPQFADTFMAAGPQGAQCVRNADFAVALPKRKQLFDHLGCKSTILVSLDQIRLDARFVMARTRWRMTFASGDDPSQDVLADSVYIVDTGGDALKIVFYLANQDIMEVLRNRGILPD